MTHQQINKTNIMFLLFTIPFLMGICIDLYVPSLPIITDYYHTTTSLAQLTIGAYMLSYSVGQVFLGVLSDSVGRRKILLASNVFFILASFTATIALNIYILILCRFLQGLGTAGMGGQYVLLQWTVFLV